MPKKHNYLSGRKIKTKLSVTLELDKNRKYSTKKRCVRSKSPMFLDKPISPTLKNIKEAYPRSKSTIELHQDFKLPEIKGNKSQISPTFKENTRVSLKSTYNFEGTTEKSIERNARYREY